MPTSSKNRSLILDKMRHLSK